MTLRERLDRIVDAWCESAQDEHEINTETSLARSEVLLDCASQLEDLLREEEIDDGNENR